MALIHAPVSIGELLDKITILEIKSERIEDATKRGNVRNELSQLNELWRQAGIDADGLDDLKAQLKQVNERLWDIEDDIRIKEMHKAFDEEFIALARRVYHENDERAAVKKQINALTGSELVEEKSYQDYR